MSSDIRSILDRLATVEGRLSPAQQRVPQLPALFRPRHIRALGAKTDPAHPMDGYMVGDSIEPKSTALEEAMAEIEEDMLSKVKKDLTQYLDRLEKKVRVDRDLKDKAVDAVKKGRAEEDLDEFAPPDGDDSGPDEEEILRRLAAQWWNGDEDPRAERALAAMGWEIGQDESGDDDAGVFLVRAGDVDGNSYMAFSQSDLSILDELDYSASSGATAQSSANRQAQTAGNAIKKYMPAATKFAANTVRQIKGQDPTKDPSYAKLSPAQQQQYVQAQKTIDATDADELEKFDANQAAADIQGVAKTLPNPANMPNVNLKSNIVPRKTPADFPPVTDGGKPVSATTPDAPVTTFEMADGKSLSCYGNDNEGYELRRGDRRLPSRFKNLHDAGMAVKLYQARRHQQSRQDLGQDYIEER